MNVDRDQNTKVIQVAHWTVNSFLVTDTNRTNYILVDSGLRTSAGHIQRTAEANFGTKPPAAIVLTHGHFDHVGSVEKLAELWDVPVYAHSLELPFLTGRCSYPPADPTAGGGFNTLVTSRFFSRGPIDLGDRIKPLPQDGSLPGLTEWRWLHTPGHTPGHISLFNEQDRILVAGDAFVTTKQESALSVLFQKKVVSRPPAYFTSDWTLAGRSIQALNKLHPRMALTGHGMPMHGRELADGLRWLASNFNDVRPAHGRYAEQPVIADERGIVSVPPPVMDSWPKVSVALVGLAGVAAATAFFRRRKA